MGDWTPWPTDVEAHAADMRQVAAPSPAVSAPDLDAIRAEAEHFAHLSDERGHMAGSLLTLLAALAAAHAETERLREAITTGKTSGVMRGALNRAQAERGAARAEVAALRGQIVRMADSLDRLAANAPSTYAGIRHTIAGELRALAADEGERTGR